MGDDHHAHHITTGGDLLWIVQQGCAHGVFLTWFPWNADGDGEGYTLAAHGTVIIGVQSVPSATAHRSLLNRGSIEEWSLHHELRQVVRPYGSCKTNRRRRSLT